MKDDSSDTEILRYNIPPSAIPTRSLRPSITSTNSTMAFNTSNSQPLIAQPLLDSFIPGFSLISSIFAQYFHIDISFYVSSLIVLLAITACWNYCGDDVVNFFSDWFISTAEIRLDDEMYNYI